jgi:DNA (cytosine-5)-methyltransferase 1
MQEKTPRCLEFFAGGGLARLGLESRFECVFANDIDPAKCDTYRANFEAPAIIEGDVWTIDPRTVPDGEIAWASFPCQDLSLAGARRGLNAPRSGAFWGFWRIIEAMRARDRAPATLALENVPGLLSSHGGRDFVALVSELSDAGYRVGAMLLDAAHFTPQSRQRLFIIAHAGRIADGLEARSPDPDLHPTALRQAYDRLPHQARLSWVWWTLPAPPRRNADLLAILRDDPPPEAWRSPDATQALMDQMAPAHRARVSSMMQSPARQVGSVFRRIRTENGARIQRAEIRCDGLAGCLRTPAGGSSSQILLVTENGRVRTRALLTEEAARLMGCPENYRLPSRRNAALKVLGDGVSVPAVRWLSERLLFPLTNARPAP